MSGDLGRDSGHYDVPVLNLLGCNVHHPVDRRDRSSIVTAVPLHRALL